MYKRNNSVFSRKMILFYLEKLIISTHKPKAQYAAKINVVGYVHSFNILSIGDRLNIKMSSYQYIWNLVLKLRRSRDRLPFNMRIHIPGKTVFILRRDPGDANMRQTTGPSLRSLIVSSLRPSDAYM